MRKYGGSGYPLSLVAAVFCLSKVKSVQYILDPLDKNGYTPCLTGITIATVPFTMVSWIIQ